MQYAVCVVDRRIVRLGQRRAGPIVRDKPDRPRRIDAEDTDGMDLLDVLLGSIDDGLAERDRSRGQQLAAR